MTQDKITDQIIEAESTDADVGGDAGAATSDAVSSGGVDGAQRFKDKDEREKQSRLDVLEAEKQSHERQMRESTVGSAKGETATNAGLDQVEAFNSGYSSRGKAGTGRGDGVDINYDDQSTIEQEDRYNTGRDVSRQRSHQARRTRVVQSSIMTDEAIREAERKADRQASRARRRGEEVKKQSEPDFELGFS